MSDCETQDPALNHRVVIMESGIDPRVLNFVRQVAGAGEIVRSVRDQTIHRKCQFRTEVSRQNRRDRTGYAGMPGRILGMTGGICQRQPIRIGRESRVTSSHWDCSHRPPETKAKLRVPAPDARIGVSCPQHGHEPCRVRSAEPFLCGQVPKSACVLLAGVLCPEEADLGLLRRSGGAVDSAESLYLVVVINPLLAVEWRGALVREELRRTRHRERNHLPKPRGYGRSEKRWRRQPITGPYRRGVWHIG